MKAIAIVNEFGLSNVALVDHPIPAPGAGEVLIKVSAVSLNSRDSGVINGFYASRLRATAYSDLRWSRRRYSCRRTNNPI